MKILHRLINKINKIVLPIENCAICLCSCESQICNDCYGSLIKQTPITKCWKCQIIKSPNEITCKNCIENNFVFDKLVTAFDYISPLNHILHKVKYENNLHYINLLSTLFYKRIIQQVTHLPDVIITIPLHPNKQNLRGFNQVDELSNIFLKNHPAINKIIANRVKETTSQATLNRYSRITNMHGAFQIDENLSNKSIAIIDDVVTSGSTVNEMARSCKKLGANKVEVWCLMRAQN